jgi:hypothetical protein
MSKQSHSTKGKQLDEEQEPQLETPEETALYNETKSALAIASSEITAEEMAATWKQVLAKYAITNDLAFLDHAIKLLEQALRLTDVDSQYRLHTLNNLASMLRLRYLHTQDIADQNRAILLYGQLVEHTPLDDLELPMYLHYLCSALIERFKVTDNMADLDRAIRAGREIRETTAQRPDSICSNS